MHGIADFAYLPEEESSIRSARKEYYSAKNNHQLSVPICSAQIPHSGLIDTQPQQIQVDATKSVGRSASISNRNRDWITPKLKVRPSVHPAGQMSLHRPNLSDKSLFRTEEPRSTPTFSQVVLTKKFKTTGAPKLSGFSVKQSSIVPANDLQRMPTFSMKINPFQRVRKTTAHVAAQQGGPAEETQQGIRASVHAAEFKVKPRNLSSFIWPRPPDSSARDNSQRKTPTVSSSTELFLVEAQEIFIQEPTLKASLGAFPKFESSRRGSGGSAFSRDSQFCWKLGTRSLKQLAELGACIENPFNSNRDSQTHQESARESSKKRSQPKVEKNLPLRLDTGMDLACELEGHQTFAKFMKIREHQLKSQHQIRVGRQKIGTHISENPIEESQNHIIEQKCSQTILGATLNQQDLGLNSVEELFKKTEDQMLQEVDIYPSQAKTIKASAAFHNIFLQGSRSCPAMVKMLSPTSSWMVDPSRISETTASKVT